MINITVINVVGKFVRSYGLVRLSPIDGDVGPTADHRGDDGQARNQQNGAGEGRLLP